MSSSPSQRSYTVVPPPEVESIGGVQPETPSYRPSTANMSPPTSGATSFFDNVKNSLSQAAQQVQTGIQGIKTQLTSPPENLVCPQCHRTIQVPPTFFDWNCIACARVNPSTQKECLNCLRPRPNTYPAMECTACHHWIQVPTTQWQESLDRVRQDVKKFVNDATSATKSKMDEWRAAPREMNCFHCGQILPIPDWQCANCTYANPCSLVGCGMCERGQRPPEKGSINCLYCHKMTEIPKQKWVNDLKKATVEVGHTAKKVYYEWIRDKPFVMCSQCQEYVEVTPGSNTLICQRCGNVIVM